jgi:hypothetical protein
MVLVPAKQTEPSLYLFAKDLNIAAKKWEAHPGLYQAVAAYSLSEIIGSAVEILSSVRSFTNKEKYATSIIEIETHKTNNKDKHTRFKFREDVKKELDAKYGK